MRKYSAPAPGQRVASEVPRTLVVTLQWPHEARLRPTRATFAQPRTWGVNGGRVGIRDDGGRENSSARYAPGVDGTANTTVSVNVRCKKK